MHAEADRSLEFEVNLIYIVSSRTAKALSQKGEKKVLGRREYSTIKRSYSAEDSRSLYLHMSYIDIHILKYWRFVHPN